MATFGLIHGAGSGAWCWELLVEELAAKGHSAVAVDLPVGDPNAGAGEYAQVLVDALASADEEVVIVGHSLGGLTAPVAAALRPAAHLVLLGAVIPTPGSTFEAYLQDHPEVFGNPPAASSPTQPDWIAVRPWEAAQRALYHDCPPELARRAWERLQPQSTRPRVEVSPLERWPDVPSTYVLMREDRAVNPDWSRMIALERTGHDAVELPGGHSPFLSRPQALASVLHELTT